MLPPLMSVSEAASRLEISRATLWRRIHDGTVPTHAVHDLGVTRLRADAVEFYARHFRWPDLSELEAPASE